MKYRIGQKFGLWKIVSNEELRDKYWNRYVLCYDEFGNELKYCRLDQLIRGTSTKSNSSAFKLTRPGISNRSKYKNLPIHVYPFFNRFRVVKKVNGKTKTFGYFKNVESAEKYSEENL